MQNTRSKTHAAKHTQASKPAHPNKEAHVQYTKTKNAKNKKKASHTNQAQHTTHLCAFCSSNGQHAVEHPLVITQLQALLDDIHWCHDRVMEHRRRRTRYGRPGRVVPRFVHPETILREKIDNRDEYS